VNQLPIFANIAGKPVILVGEGEAADAKRRLIERAGGVCTGPENAEARLAFVAVEDAGEAASIAAVLKARGLLVNVVDQPEYCDFTTPAIVDRDPVLIAIGTGGASAGLAKALRQRLELMLPQRLGQLAEALFRAKNALKARWPEGSARRKAIDDALREGGMLDPFAVYDTNAVPAWLASASDPHHDRFEVLSLSSTEPDALTLRQARLLGQADHIFYDANVPGSILSRARADAVRHEGAPPVELPTGVVLHLQLQSDAG
jgi:uroporphyrin-III C-methyltransferase / precorrin-2 dehydrogenase / sirohydrochlorin ferrochelatase